MNVSKKSFILLALSALAAVASAAQTDVTSVGSTTAAGPQGWYMSNNSSTVEIAATPTNDGDGSVHFSGSNAAYTSFGNFPGGSGNGFPALGSLLALSTGSISADLYRSSASNTTNPATQVSVKLVFSGNRQLTWESAYNGNITTQDSWFNQMMGGDGNWWIRGLGSATGKTTNFDTPGNYQPLSAWAAGFTPSGYTGGSLLGADVLGYTVGFGSGVGSFDGALDHLSVNYTGGTSTTFNFRTQATPEPAPLAGLALGAVAFLRRRKRA